MATDCLESKGKSFLQSIQFMMNVIGPPTLPNGQYAILHPIMVADWLGRCGAMEETQIAALFHNLLYQRKPWLDELSLKLHFGAKILAIVIEVCEKERDIPWRERKQRLLDNLNLRSIPALEIIVADRLTDLNNLQSWIVTRGLEEVCEKMSLAGKDWDLNAKFHYELNRRINDSSRSKTECLTRLINLHRFHCEQQWPQFSVSWED